MPLIWLRAAAAAIWWRCKERAAADAYNYPPRGVRVCSREAAARLLSLAVASAEAEGSSSSPELSHSIHAGASTHKTAKRWHLTCHVTVTFATSNFCVNWSSQFGLTGDTALSSDGQDRAGDPVPLCAFSTDLSAAAPTAAERIRCRPS
jgi:hypothetical protein